MGDHLKKVQARQPLRIPAAAYNAFIDAANDYRRRQRSTASDPRQSFRQAGIVLVRNDTGADRERFDVVGLDAPIVLPGDNLDEFKRAPAFAGVLPKMPDHRGQFAVLMEPVKSGEIAAACVSGIVPARIDVQEEIHPRADVVANSTRLTSGYHGAAEILWKEQGTGAKWALVKIGVGEPLGVSFIVRLEQVGGEAGDNGESACTYTYDVYDLVTNEKLNKDGALAPQAPRPALTQMTAASYGVAYWSQSGNSIEVVLAEAFEQPTPRQIIDVVTSATCAAGSSGGQEGLSITFQRTRILLPNGSRLLSATPISTFCPCCCGSGSNGSESSNGSGGGSNGGGGDPGNGGSDGSGSDDSSGSDGSGSDEGSGSDGSNGSDGSGAIGSGSDGSGFMGQS